MCEGCYKELSMLDYDMQNQEELNNIIFLETVSLIRDSVSLGYRCFHAEYANVDCESIEKLGEAFGNTFQYLNDLEPFSQKTLYKKHKGGIKNFDLGRKNIALFLLYNRTSEDEKVRIHKEKEDKKYDGIVGLYKRYNIEQKVLNEVKEKVSEIKELLRVLSAGNGEWVKAFRVLFNYALKEKGWGDKVENL